MIYDKDRHTGDYDDEFWDDDDLDISPAPDMDDTPDDYPYPYGHYAPAEPEADDAHEHEEDTPYDYYAPEKPEQTEKPDKPRRRFFSLGKDEEENDFYDSEAEPQPAPPKRKTPRLDPEDPDYWIGEESALSGIIPKPRKTWIWWLIGAVAAIALIIGSWIWFMRPHTDGAVKYGYIKTMERRGSVIKTFEGVLIPYRELGDPTPFYFEEIPFSVQCDSLATRMKRMMLDCIPVRLEYETYHSPLPWKGESNIVIVKADTADTSKILPPEYR